jgi:hypothetical protein
MRFHAPVRTGADADPVLGIGPVLGGHLAGPLSNSGWGSAANPIRLVTAPVVGCVDPLLIVPVVPPRLTTTDALVSFQKPGDRRYFAYLDWMSSEPDRWRLLAMRIWQRAKETVHSSNYLHSNVMLYISESRNCHVVEAIDWKKYWQVARFGEQNPPVLRLQSKRQDAMGPSERVSPKSHLSHP